MIGSTVNLEEISKSTMQDLLDHPVPRYLCRYYPPDVVDPILGPTLKVTPPNEFNDPFEFLPSRQVPFDDERRSFDDLIRRFTNEFAVASFSNSPDSILMWSHYAQNHTGYVVKYAMPEACDNTTILPVAYKCERLRAPENFNKEVLQLFFFQLTCTKSRRWKYEKEWRAFFQLRETLRHFCNGKLMYLRKVCPGAIAEVIFGWRSEGQNGRAEILNELSTNAAYAHVKTSKAELDPTRFRLNIVDM